MSYSRSCLSLLHNQRRGGWGCFGRNAKSSSASLDTRLASRGWSSACKYYLQMWDCPDWNQCKWSGLLANLRIVSGLQSIEVFQTSQAHRKIPSGWLFSVLPLESQLSVSAIIILLLTLLFRVRQPGNRPASQLSQLQCFLVHHLSVWFYHWHSVGWFDCSTLCWLCLVRG